jgi:hypothetical protein
VDYDNSSDDDDDDDHPSSSVASSDASDLLFGEKRNYPFSTCVLGTVNDETPVKHNKKQRTAGRILSGSSGDSLVPFLLNPPPPSIPLVTATTTTAAAASTNPIINPSSITDTMETVTATMDDSVDAISCAVVEAMESGDNISIPSLRLVSSCSESDDDNEEEEEEKGANACGATTLQQPLAQQVVPPQLVCVSNYTVQELHTQLSTCCCHDRDGCSDGNGVYLIPHIICSEDSKLPEELGGLRQLTDKCTSKTAAAFTFTHCNRHREQSTLPESAAAICGSIGGGGGGGGSSVSRSQRHHSKSQSPPHTHIAATVSDLAVRLEGPRVFLGKGGYGYAVKCQLLIEQSSRQHLFKEYGSTMKRRRDFNDASDRESGGKMSVVLKIDHKQWYLMWEVIVHHQVGFSNITLLNNTTNTIIYV